MTLMERFDAVRRALRRAGKKERDTIDLVASKLYAEHLGAGSGQASRYPESILLNETLIALGALMMSSARGSVAEVINLNFDDVLDWYLHLHGFHTQVVSKFPTLISGDVDAVILHPHGFAPLCAGNYEASQTIVLSLDDYRGRLARDNQQPWTPLLTSCLMSKTFLAVGTSLRELDLDVLLSRTKEALIDHRALGFLIGSSTGCSTDRVEELLQRGIVPVVLDEWMELPKLILEICQRAATLRRSL